MFKNLFRRDEGHVSVDTLSQYVDGRVPGEAVKGHLAACVRCSEDLAELLAAKTYLGSLGEVALPRSFMPLIADPRPVPWWWDWLPGLRMATGAAAALLVLAIGMESALPIAPMASAPAAGALRDAAAPALRSAPVGAAAAGGGQEAAPGAPMQPVPSSGVATAAPSPVGNAYRAAGPPAGDRYASPPPQDTDALQGFRPGAASAGLVGALAVLGSLTTILAIRRRHGV